MVRFESVLRQRNGNLQEIGSLIAVYFSGTKPLHGYLLIELSSLVVLDIFSEIARLVPRIVRTIYPNTISSHIDCQITIATDESAMAVWCSSTPRLINADVEHDSGISRIIPLTYPFVLPIVIRRRLLH